MFIFTILYISLSMI